MSKRGHIAVFILGLFVLVLIVVFGAIGIRSVKEKGAVATKLQFRDQFIKDVASMRYQYGSTSTNTYQLPSGFDEICFVGSSADQGALTTRPVILNHVMDGSQENVFLFGSSGFESFYVEGLEVSDYPKFTCAKPKAVGIELQLQSLGKDVAIKTLAYKRFCQNAELAPNWDREAACPALDFVFGSGYMQQCCDHYNLCCGLQ